MNMLINLMGVTFARVTEEEERLNWKWRTEFYTDWLWLSISQKAAAQRYLYIVEHYSDRKEA